jgi:hypothetical protein
MAILTAVTISFLIGVNVANEDFEKRAALTIIVLLAYSFLLLISQYNV